MKKDCRKKKKDEANRTSEKGNAAIEEVDASDHDSLSELGFMCQPKKKVTFNLAPTFFDAPKAPVIENKGLLCTIDGEKYPSFTDDTMFGDSCASCHLRNDDTDMYDIENINEMIGGIGGNVQLTKKGKLRCLVKQVDGTSTEKVLTVKYGEKAGENLFSITKELSYGAKLGSNDENNIILTYPDGSIVTFDRRIKTKDGWVGGVDIVPISSEIAQLGSQRIVNINDYHKELGHPSESTTRATAKLGRICKYGHRPRQHTCKTRNKNERISPILWEGSKEYYLKLYKDIW